MMPRLFDPISLEAFVRGCNALGIAPELAVKDPTITLRLAGSAPVEAGQAFVDVVCEPKGRPNLHAMRPDVSALTVALIWIQLVDKVRRQIRARRDA